MNIEYVISYIETIKLGSISAAAERCNLSQSALSQQIKVLEKSFNTKLLERSPKGITPTQTGNIAYKHFLSMVDSYNNVFDEIDKINSACDTVKIISTSFACTYALPCTFYHFRNKYPDYTLEIETSQSNIIEEKILKGHGDMGIILGKTNNKRISCKKVFADKFYLVCNQAFEIPENIKREDIYKYPFVTLTKNHRTQKMITKQLAENQIDVENLNLLYAVDTTDAIKLSVMNGFGIAFLPYMSIKKELYNKQLRLINCDDVNLEGTYYSIKLRNSTSLCLGKDKVLEYIEKVLSQTIC